nr:MAG TPA: hypothetical protein [Caudoviricetes sp.]
MPRASSRVVKRVGSPVSSITSARSSGVQMVSIVVSPSLSCRGLVPS